MARIGAGLLAGAALGSSIPSLVKRYPPAAGDRQAPRPPLWLAIGASAVVCAALAWRMGRPARALPLVVVVPALLSLAWIDATIYRLPRRLVFHALALATGGACLAALIEPSLAERVVAGAVAAVATSAALAIVWWMSPRGLGYGDVRLQLLLGALCGWVSRLAALRCLLWAFLLGGIAAIALLATHRRGRSDVIPFGPFLIAGALIAILWPR